LIASLKNLPPKLLDDLLRHKLGHRHCHGVSDLSVPARAGHLVWKSEIAKSL
jgi:hypothetical protein